MIVEHANRILADLRSQGYVVTLRQLYYQFVSEALIPNTMRSYKNLGATIDRARYAGLIDWDAIEDRTRNLAGGDDVTREPAKVIRSFADYYEVSRWDGQPYHVEVWVEKDALIGVAERAASLWNAPYFACRGYVSSPELKAASERLLGMIKAGRPVVILHLGDHDPSGIDMTRDMTERLANFIAMDWWLDQMGRQGDETSYGVINAHMQKYLDQFPAGDQEAVPDIFLGFELRRIALNYDQVQQYGPPPNPAKLTDSRAQNKDGTGYIDRFGRESWELDALRPAVLVDLIRSHLEPLIDMEKWAARDGVRDELRAQFATVADNWAAILEQYAS
jgi:hypothetical protein